MIPSIVGLGPEEAVCFAPLFDEVWPAGAPHDEDVAWAFRSRCRPGAVIIGAFSEVDGCKEAVGARGSLVWPLAGGPSKLRVCQLHGTCVSSRYRRHGVFSAMNREFLRQFGDVGGDAIFNVSVHASRAGYEKLGWQYLPGLRRFIRFRRPLRVLANAFRGGGRLRGGTTPSVPTATIPQPEWPIIAPFHDAREGELSSVAHTSYDREFYEWRFSRKDTAYGWAGTTNVGFAVYRTFVRRGLKEVLIGDLWPRVNSKGATAALLAQIIRQEEPDLLSAVFSLAHPLRRFAWRLGWIPDPKGDLNMGVRALSKNGAWLANPSRWSLAMADIDTF